VVTLYTAVHAYGLQQYLFWISAKSQRFYIAEHAARGTLRHLRRLWEVFTSGTGDINIWLQEVKIKTLIRPTLGEDNFHTHFSF